MSSPRLTPEHEWRWLTAPSFVALVSVLNLIVLAVVVNLVGPHEKLLAANGVLVCGQFETLVKNVRAQSIPVSSIRDALNDLDAKSAQVDRNLRPPLHGFVHAAREAVAAYNVYPTFDLMAYSETYKDMDAHMMAQDSIKMLSKTCAAEGYTAKSGLVQGNAYSLQGFLTRRHDPVASPPVDAAVEDAQQALAAVQGYLATKSWGDFGARCDLWVSMHYRSDLADIAYAPQEKGWVIDVPRKEEALGPEVVRYHVDAYTGVTSGDPSNNQASQFAEGCDRY